MIKHKFVDLIRKDTKMRGFYRGVVETEIPPPDDHSDGHGRVQCRIFGIHSQSKVLDDNLSDGIPTADLPWCEPAIPITEFGPTETGGTGMFSVPQVGSHVLIFFENENLMKPIYFAALPAMTEWGDGDPTPTSTNFVFKVPGGHYIEFDSTSGNERIKVFHSIGTEVEIDSTGNISIIGKDGITVTLTGDLNITINGNCTITTTGMINLN